jgi:hypothetical protein
MTDLVCPHCHNNVPRGASVCRGCHAELKYGPAQSLFGGALIVAVFVGIKLGSSLPASLSFVGWIIGIAIFGGLSMLITKHYKDRVIFKRIYRTK